MDKSESQTLTSREYMLIAIESCLHFNTVQTVYNGGGHQNSKIKVKKAAKKLGLPLPEEVVNGLVK